jgi:hypothetical protein
MKTIVTAKYSFLKLTTVLLLVFMVSTSCEKVINVDLNEAASRIVIEGLIDDGPGPYTVRLSRSGSYFDQPVLPMVSGADVIISDNTGIKDTLIERSPGVYLTSKIHGTPGKTYTLNVTTENMQYTGSSTMHTHVNVDSLRLMRTEVYHFNLGGGSSDETTISVYCYFKDPQGKNFYRVKVHSHGSSNNEDYRLFDDQYTDGENTELRIAHAEAGDTIRVDLFSLDQTTYGYYRTLRDLLHTNPVFGSTPANPETNLSNGALGYFGACAVSSRIIVITSEMINRVK